MGTRPVSHRVEVFVGPFGSGKTEVALNRALSLVRAGTSVPSVPSVTFIDLDVVDPYFRARDARATLEAAGVRFVAPAPEWDSVDLPLLTTQMLALPPEGRLLIDAGGEAHGALVLRQLGRLLPADAAIYLVVNPYRPFMRTPERIDVARRRLETAGGVAITALIANPHLSLATTPEVIQSGFHIVREASLQMRLPVAWTAVAADLVGKVDLPGEILPLVFHMLPPWELEVA
ncbi:MAG TPA: hypothetical protein VFU46_12840 [Gemmatimonadales bacterium]|nr:hypothetical protein [Gemmatimonadales bacterium]